MTTDAIIKEINKLPLFERLLVIEKTLKAIRQDKKQNLEHAAHLLWKDYREDKELTVFTQLDEDNFYEPR